MLDSSDVEAVAARGAVCDEDRGVIDSFKPVGCREVQLHVLVFRDERYHSRSDGCGDDAGELDQRQGDVAAVYLCGWDSDLDLLQLGRVPGFLATWWYRGGGGGSGEGKLHVLDVYVCGVLLAVDVYHQYLKY